MSLLKTLKHSLTKTRGQIAMWNKLSFVLKNKCAKQVSQHTQTPSVCLALMKENRKHGQIAMWMLTKFAMIFFIGALALILFAVADIEKEGLCNVSAQRTNKNIANSLIQMLSSPVEDERRIIPLESSLSIGSEDLAKYEINITEYENEGKGIRELRIETTVKTRDCGSKTRVPIKLENLEIILIDGDDAPAFTLNPSKKGDRSKFLVVIKCRDKINGSKHSLLLQDCKHDNPAECMQFNSNAPEHGGNIFDICEWQKTGEEE